MKTLVLCVFTSRQKPATNFVFCCPEEKVARRKRGVLKLQGEKWLRGRLSGDRGVGGGRKGKAGVERNGEGWLETNAQLCKLRYPTTAVLHSVTSQPNMISPYKEG